MASNIILDDRSRAFVGPGKGEDDKIPTDLPEGCYIIDAHSVAFLGDGSTRAGVKILEIFEHDVIRKFYKELTKNEQEADDQGDDIPAMLSDGEYQISPLVVTLLGHGNNQEGAKILKLMVRNLRRHKISNGVGLPPKAKDIWQYMPPQVRRWNHA